MDKKARERELKRTLAYMKRQKLITEDYEHGLQITAKAKKRLRQIDIDTLSITIIKTWDHKWRLCFYDVPENQKHARNTLSASLRRLGCIQLQRSVWIHPYPYEKELLAIAAFYGVERYITYLETTYIANEEKLIQQFPKLHL
ncbi:MAG TPA: hypothetical protein VK983_02320 [Candidatus Limnocylindrales bacterium]|nr:hypothetical protein [Candidatus Limnocylindrales bacterium]